MKTFYWLVKREFWEHRGGFLWTPLITVGVVVLINIMLLIATGVIGGQKWHHIANASPDQLHKLGVVLAGIGLMPAGIVFVVLFFVLFTYCMKTLSNDRVDRSILFWKSLPISDLSTILSKAFSAVVVAPVIATVLSLIGAILMLLIYAINASFHGIGFGQAFWSLPHTGELLISIIGLLPIYMVWMLPCVGWLMLCSAWANGKVARWAIALPTAVGVIFSWLGLMGVLGKWSLSWFWKVIWVHIILGVLPGSWIGALGQLQRPESLNGVQITAQHSAQGTQFDVLSNKLLESIGWQYHLFATPEMLWGIVAGIVMLAGAIWLRRWRTEL